MESLSCRVFRLFRGDVLTSAPVEEGGETAGQPFVLGNGLDQRSPGWVPPCGTRQRGLDHAASLKARAEPAEQI